MLLQLAPRAVRHAAATGKPPDPCCSALLATARCLIRRCFATDGAAHYADLLLAHTPGKGRGLIAAQPLRAGQLLLDVPALALVQGPDGQRPDPEALVDRLRSAAFGTQQLAWLRILSDHVQPPSPAGGPPAPLPLRQLPHPPHAAASAATTTATAANMDDVRFHAASLVQRYAFGDEHDDLLLAHLHGRPPTSQVGLWAEFALLNHSCCPNAVHYVAGDRMVVRATAPIAPGEEVTVSYLAREALAPAGVRQAALESTHGFCCGCPRCSAEARLPRELATALEAAHGAVAAHMEALQAAVEAGSMDAVGAVYDGAQALHRELHGVMMAAVGGGRPRGGEGGAGSDAAAGAGRQWSADECGEEVVAARWREGGAEAAEAVRVARQASYGLQELLYVCGSALEDANSVLWLCSCLAVLEEVSAGDELHVFAACRLQDLLREGTEGRPHLRAEAQGEDGEERAGGSQRQAEAGAGERQLQAAQRLCGRAHLLRYGDLDAATLQAYIDGSSELAKLFL